MVSYDLYWRIGHDHYLEVLNEQEQKEYIERVKMLLDKIDDYILLNNPKHKTMYKRNAAFDVKKAAMLNLNFVSETKK